MTALRINSPALFRFCVFLAICSTLSSCATMEDEEQAGSPEVSAEADAVAAEAGSDQDLDVSDVDSEPLDDADEEITKSEEDELKDEDLDTPEQPLAKSDPAPEPAPIETPSMGQQVKILNIRYMSQREAGSVVVDTSGVPEDRKSVV